MKMHHIFTLTLLAVFSTYAMDQKAYVYKSQWSSFVEKINKLFNQKDLIERQVILNHFEEALKAPSKLLTSGNRLNLDDTIKRSTKLKKLREKSESLYQEAIRELQSQQENGMINRLLFDLGVREYLNRANSRFNK